MASKAKAIDVFRSTKEVALYLGVSTARLSRAVWDGRINPPNKGPGGAFMWDAEAIHEARRVLNIDMEKGGAA